MNSNEILRLVVKLTGLVIFLSGVIQAASYLPITIMALKETDINSHIISELGAFATPLILGAFLWLFPAPIANTIVKEELSRKNNSELLEGLEKIGIRILGLYLLYFGISDLVTNYSAYSLDVRMFGENMQYSEKRYTTLFVATGVEIVMALFLLFGSEIISKVIKKIKYAS